PSTLRDFASPRPVSPTHCSRRMVWPEARAAVARRAGRFPSLLEWPVAAIWAMAATGLLLLVIFDLSPPLAFNDDWMYAWSAGQLVAGHGLHVFPESTALALVQVVWGAAFSLGHPDPRLLVLAPLQRQIGLALIPAVMLGLLLFRWKTWTRADTAAAVAMWTLPAAIAYAAARLAVSHSLYSSLNVAALDVGHAIFPLVP